MTAIDLDQQIYTAVRQIPSGKVATYGDIARQVQCSPRQVGFWLHRNPDPQTTPCHRVVFANGALAASYAFGGCEAQQRRLREEGVTIHTGQVELRRYRASNAGT